MSKLEYILLLLVMWLLLSLTLSGCGTLTPVFDENGRIKEVKSFKIFTDISCSQKIDYDVGTGKKKSEEITISTQTNADRIIDSVNKTTGTLIDGAGKVMP